ncbi:major facilitator superfamily domain-containing protein [Scheffersomyces amazonensis]|uniref:major facilitator superfamily domain-containing protein n=1 Tax=Scheffersomyces amazonensis TaxID=1078765 RepID=UPI00315D47F6
MFKKKNKAYQLLPMAPTPTPSVSSSNDNQVLANYKTNENIEQHSVEEDLESRNDGKIKEVDEKYADLTLKLIQDYGDKVQPLTPEQEKKLVHKIYFSVVLIGFLVNFTLFLDKNAMGYATLLGLFQDAHLTQESFNNLQTLFYVGYLISQVPSHILFQKIRLSRYITIVTFTWSFLSLIQLTAHNFSGLAIIRFLLGFSEAGVTAAIQHTLAMFLKPDEHQIVSQIWWISCLAAGIPGGLIAYAVQFVVGVAPWKVYWAIIGAFTFALSLACFFFYPDNPATYKVFTIEERVHIINRVKAATRSSIEQKTVKKYQIKESLRDPVSWLFGLHVFLLMFANNMTFQSAIIYKDLGFSNLSSTLVSIASACWSAVLAIAGGTLLFFFRNQAAHVGTLFCMVALLGGILAISLPWERKIGLLAAIFLSNGTGICYTAALTWSQGSAAGYTKKLSRTIIWFLAYSVINLIAPQFWRSKDKPRYYPAWGLMIAGAWVSSPIVLQIIRYILVKRNKERLIWLKQVEDGLIEDTIGYVDEVDENGNLVRREVDISMLDLTDLENKRFIYPL